MRSIVKPPLAWWPVPVNGTFTVTGLAKMRDGACQGEQRSLVKARSWPSQQAASSNGGPRFSGRRSYSAALSALYVYVMAGSPSQAGAANEPENFRLAIVAGPVPLQPFFPTATRLILYPCLVW